MQIIQLYRTIFIIYIVSYLNCVLISNVLSKYILIFFLVKVPQIVKIFKNKSGEGINILSVLLDLFAITSMSSYSFCSRFPFR